MSSKSPPPEFSEFTRWLRYKVDVAPSDLPANPKMLDAARSARDEALGARKSGFPSFSAAAPHVEVLQLLAAASTGESTRPPELTTAKGFRVTLAYDDGGSATNASICVLVQCPPDQIAQVQGQTAYIWNGSQRFELGQFDSDGKAIGTLPAGIEITLSDFATGNVKLEAPGSSSES